MSRIHGGNVPTVWRRDKGICHLCACHVALKDASRDHVETASNGGYDKADNYRLAHLLCNHARGNLPIDLAYQVVQDLRDAGVRITPKIASDALYNRLRDYRRFLRAGQRQRRA